MAASTFERRMARPLLTLVLFTSVLYGNAAAADAAEWRLHTVDVKSQPRRIYLQDGEQSLRRVRIRTADDSWLFLNKCGELICAESTTAGYKRLPVPRGALPDAEVARGNNGILSAWYAAPTRRYDHGVLGDAIEASALVVVDRTKKRHRLDLGLDSVFEDRKPRLGDLDGDGTDEIVTVRSYLDRGAALAVVKLTGHGTEIKGETPPIGRSHRWLNPAGIADFDGDGRAEVAIVVTPHIGGTLQFWEFQSGRMKLDLQLRGFSNHSIGSRVQEMSAVADFNGDGVVDLALPSDDQRSIRIISLAGGAAAEVARIAMPARIVTELIAIKPRGAKRPVLITGLSNSKLALIN